MQQGLVSRLDAKSRRGGSSALWGWVLVLCLLQTAAVAQDARDAPTTDAQGQTLTVDYSVRLRGRTPEEAKQLALDGARADAVRRVVGTQVQAERSISTIETDDELVERFSQVVRTGAGGRVVEERIVEAGIEEQGGQDVVYRVRVEATVQPDVGRPDPAFVASLSLNKESQVYVARSSRRASDEVVATVTATQDAYLTLFSVTQDTIQVIWPNSLVEEAFVSASDSVAFPSQSWRARGLRLRVEVPPGRDRITERLFLVATKTRIPFRPTPNVNIRDGTLRTVESSLLALNRWLVGIPLDQRATATATYDVRRAP